ncbi:helix-turn-helix domain-containing protein (plasmid) [Bacillus sp. PGP15]|uniref:helix-turn-helix domain-containing protein n=1 Tax=Bacillus TaxID=1386 RepID=UPI0020011CF5|nr:helix-turn-helix domain-containing protein [Bacillus sp. PGP15]UPL47375.1 helix-turn-helix domain-containing protein [Bacillus sp. PGP15]
MWASKYHYLQKLGRNKAYELLQSGKIKSFKVGKSYRIPKICIQNYVLAKVQI